MRLRRDIIHKTTGLVFSKRWDSFHKTTRIFFEGFSHPFFAPRSESVLLFVLSRRGGCLMGLNRVWTGFEQGLNGFCSMLVQWLFNACSMAVQWLFNGWRKVVTMRCVLRFLLRAWMRTLLLFMFRLPWVFLVVEKRVYLGGCFSRKAWQRGCIKMHILDTPSKVRLGGCLAVFRDVFSSTVKALTERFCPEERKVKRHSAR